VVKCTAVQGFALRQLPGTKGTKRTKRAWKFRKGIKGAKNCLRRARRLQSSEKAGKFRKYQEPKGLTKAKDIAITDNGSVLVVMVAWTN